MYLCVYLYILYQFLKLQQLLIHAFFVSNTIISNVRLKWAKNQTNAKQHPAAELLLFENDSHSSYTLSSKNNRTYSKKEAEEQTCLY